MTRKISLAFILSITFLIALGAQVNNTSEINFNTKDNQTISATYLIPQTKVENYPAIILIHQGGSSKQEWLGLSITDRLIKEGYAILAYDIRQHGKSSKDKGDIFDLFNNPNRAPLDLQAAINFLHNDKRINTKRIGIMGASVGANLACVAASDSKYGVKSIVSLSSKTSAAQNLSGNKAPIKLKNAFHIASKNEQGGLRKKWAEELYAKTSRERKIVIAEGNQHGAHILKANQNLNNEIIEWFKKTL
ncbi:alpha/beta fold hydrolase [Flavobacteriaceae bacterium AU392]|nr:alpha/beta fold hydrolase [Flavobacteriaceae bacterium]RKM83730.1 alpha/beta fold hydrolase [Flavobacteriaceae bacterium AU392]